MFMHPRQLKLVFNTRGVVSVVRTLEVDAIDIYVTEKHKDTVHKRVYVSFPLDTRNTRSFATQEVLKTMDAIGIALLVWWALSAFIERRGHGRNIRNP